METHACGVRTIGTVGSAVLTSVTNLLVGEIATGSSQFYFEL